MSRTPNPALVRLPPRKAHQRRVVLTLSTAQLLSGVGNGASLAIGSLLAVEITGSNAFAGAATTAISVAGAVAALPLAGLAVRRGRRRALSTGLVLAAVGAAGMVLTPVFHSFWMLLLSAALLGVGNAANLQARFAATDLAEPHSRGRDLGLVVWAITIGAVAGPNLIGPGAAIGASLGLPELSGPFLFSLAGMLLALLILNAGLRPDPLVLAHLTMNDAGGAPLGGAGDAAVNDAGDPSLDAPGNAAGAVATPPVATPLARPEARRRGPTIAGGVAALREYPAARLGVAAIVVSHLVMVAVMSMTPVQLMGIDAAESAGTMAGMADGASQAAAHHATADQLVVIGFVISLHIAGMYALSPLVGMLADRWGRRRTMALAQLVLAASLLCSALGASSRTAITVGLVLLGLGWSLGTVAGSAFVSESVPGPRRVVVQGLSDTLMGAAGALGAAGSGVVLALAGFRGLNLLALVAVAGMAAWCLLALRRSRPAARTIAHDDGGGTPGGGTEAQG